MKRIVGALFLSVACSLYANPLKEGFHMETDLRPYLRWIATNTRFSDAENIKNIELPEIQLLDSFTYNQLIRVPSQAVYVPEYNRIYVNQDRVQGDPGTILHELVHFYQIRSGKPLSKEALEEEAYAIERKFNKQF